MTIVGAILSGRREMQKLRYWGSSYKDEIVKLLLSNLLNAITTIIWQKCYRMQRNTLEKCKRIHIQRLFCRKN